MCACTDSAQMSYTLGVRLPQSNMSTADLGCLYTLQNTRTPSGPTLKTRSCTLHTTGRCSTLCLWIVYNMQPGTVARQSSSVFPAFFQPPNQAKMKNRMSKIGSIEEICSCLWRLAVGNGNPRLPPTYLSHALTPLYRR